MTFFQDVWGILTKYYPQLLQGVGYTLLISLIGTVAGLLIGMLTGVVRTAPKSHNPVVRVLHQILNGIIAVYVEIFRGTPMMVQAMVIYWGYAFATGGSTLPLIPSGILIVSINTGAYMAESVRGGIISIDPGQTEGAKAIGMTHFQTMVNVIMPQALRNIMPQIGNNYIINVKDTSVMFIIGFTEFFAQHRYIVGVNNMYFPSATVEMIGYLTLTLVASFALRLIEKLMDGSDSYELAQGDQLVMAAGTYSHPDRGTPFDEVNREYTGEEKRNRIRIGLKNRNGSMRGGR